MKRAIASATRAIAEKSELEINYTADNPGSSGNVARLPHPDIRLTSDNIANVRGLADSFALKHRFHDDKTHSSLRPRGDLACKIFDAVEQARVEALGGRIMDGVRDNLATALEVRCDDLGFDKASSETELPIETAVELLARERMTGKPVPESTRPRSTCCAHGLRKKQAVIWISYLSRWRIKRIRNPVTGHHFRP